MVELALISDRKDFNPFISEDFQNFYEIVSKLTKDKLRFITFK
jgi:hypothetical protein